MRMIHGPVLNPAGRAGGRVVVAVALGLLVLALLVRDAVAQQRTEPSTFDLTGQVVGEGGQPLVGAFVSFLESDWGSLTDEDGRFRIPDVAAGPVILRAEQLGYETLEWEGVIQDGEPVLLSMDAKPILLEGLMVVTDRFDNRRRATATSVRWFDRADLATTPQETAFDFIRARAGLVPAPCRGIRHTDRCLRVRGRVTEPVVWVDEAPVIGGVEYLESMPPHELYMVEVYASGRHIRAYTNRFMQRAAEVRLRPIPFLF